MQNKCPEFKGEQCNHCLVQPVETRKIEDMGDDRHIENHVSKNVAFLHVMFWCISTVLIKLWERCHE